MAEIDTCCLNMTQGKAQISPFKRILSLGYYDGPTMGITQCANCQAEYKFDIFSWDDQQDIRIYGLFPLPQGGFSKIIDALSLLGHSGWPIWVPQWEFSDEQLRMATDDLVKEVIGGSGMLKSVVAAKDLSKEILAFRNLNGSEARTLPKNFNQAKDWFAFLDLSVMEGRNNMSMSKNSITWARLVESHKNFTLALQDFFEKEVDRVGILRSALRGNDRFTAISIAGYLTKDELLQLFPDLLSLASFSHGAIETVRDLIKSLPLERVLDNIEQVAEPLLNEGGYDEYRRLLELYVEIDRDLAIKLAKKALENSDYDIREAGEDFMKKLS